MTQLKISLNGRLWRDCNRTVLTWMGRQLPLWCCVEEVVLFGWQGLFMQEVLLGKC